MVSPLPAEEVFANVNPFAKDSDEKAGSTQNTVDQHSAPAATNLVEPDTVTWRPTHDSDYKIESVSPSRSEDVTRSGV
nr:hypothetical protein CFP56_04041 [Quercus suber]